MENYLSKKELSTFVVLSALILLELCIFLPWGHDSNFHIMRLGQEATLISDQGIFGFPFYIYPDVYNGYGYGSPMFYCDLFFIPFSLLCSFGLDSVLCYKIMVSSIAVLSFCICYFSIMQWKQDKELALIGALLYALQPYFLLDLFTRSAIGESLALCFEPLVVYGIYAIFSSKERTYRKGICFLGVGVGLCLLSHLISSFLIVISLFIVCLLQIKRIIKTPSILFRLLMASFICLLITAWFWVPMVEQLLSVSFKAFEYNDYFLTNVMNLIELLVPYKFLYRLSLHPDNVGWFIGGAILCPLGIICLSIKEKLWKNSKSIYWIIGAIILITIIMISKPICIFLYPLIGNIRLPWRLMIIVTICTMLLSLFLINNKSSKHLTKVVVLLTICTSVYVMSYQMLASAVHTLFPSEYPLKDEIMVYSDKNGDDLYLPVQVDTNYIEERGLIVSSNYQNVLFQYTNMKYEVCVTVLQNNHPDLSLEFPRIYYPGYTAEINGEKATVIMSGNGLVKVCLPDGFSGNVVVSYCGTVAQKVSKIVSFISIISLAVYVFFSSKKMKNRLK